MARMRERASFNPVVNLRHYRWFMDRGHFRWALTLVAALFCACAGVPAAAQDLYAESCVLPANEIRTLDEAQAATGWICTPSKRHAAARHSWVRIPVEAAERQPTRLVGDAMATDGMLIARVSADGTRHSEYFDSQRIAHNWTTGTRFALPLDLAGVETVFIRFDHPLGPDAASSIAWKAPEAVEWERWTSLAFLGIIIGMLSLNVVISAFIAFAIRRRFAWYHCAFSTLLIVYVATSGSLVFLVFPDMTLWTRSVISYCAAAWAIALLGPFILDFFEEDMVSQRMRRIGTAAAWLVFSAGLMLPLGALFDVSLRPLYNLAFLPGAALTLIATYRALRRGSSAARAFAVAWAAPLVFALERVVRNLGAYRLPPLADFAFYGALAVEAGILTLAIGWLVSRMRHERDLAIAERSLMEREARHDALTGLPNRRDYDHREWRDGETLALLDLDHFKTVNDHYGHATGDAVLKIVGAVLAQAVADGTIDRAWRMGGEEFAVAIRAGGVQHGAVAINTVRARIPYAVHSELVGLDVSVTASAGLADIDVEDVSASYRAADRMLYSAKMAGRDRLCYDDQGPTDENGDGAGPKAADTPPAKGPKRDPEPVFLSPPAPAGQPSLSRKSSYPKAFTSSSASVSLSQR